MAFMVIKNGSFQSMQAYFNNEYFSTYMAIHE